MHTNRKLTILFLVVLTVAAGVTAVTAFAKSGNDAGTSNAAVTISSDQAKAIAEKAVGGTATAVEQDDEDGGGVYDVQVGNKEVKVDATSGQVLKTEDEGADDQKGDNQSEVDHEDASDVGDNQDGTEIAD